MGAYATDFVEKMWPLELRAQPRRKFPTRRGRHSAIGLAAPGRLPLGPRAGGGGQLSQLRRVRDRGRSTRAARAPRHGARPCAATCSRMVSRLGHGLLGRNAAHASLLEIEALRGEGDMPRLQIIRLPNDHTHGTTPGWRTPAAYVAENDLALGQIVEAVSHSKFWPQTAIFVVEDDAQNGPDHVDAHRTVLSSSAPTPSAARWTRRMYHQQHAAHDGTDPGPQADVAVRRRRDAHVRGLLGRSPT